MDRLLLLVGIGIFAFSVVALGFYAWNGQWFVVVFALFATFIGALVCGFIELLLSPLGLAATASLRRGNRTVSLVLTAITAIATRAAFALYCLYVLNFLLERPGAPTWLAIILASAIASAPFSYINSRQKNNSPENLDTLSASLGVWISGALAYYGADFRVAALPTVALFFISALVITAWWYRVGMSSYQADLL